MRHLLAGLAALVTFSALADDVTWSWQNPTTNTNGSAIPATGNGALTGGRFEFGTCGAGGTFGTKAGEITLTQAQVTAKTVTQTNILPSTVCARVYVRNSYGNESAASNVATVTIQAPTPNPPTSLTVTSTRIEAAEWTCRDAAGTILSSHVRQDTAQTACTNRALMAANTPFEIRPSGYRIVAR